MAKRELTAYTIVAQNICRLRNERGLTQEKLCEFAGVDRAFYQRVESGKRNMSVDYLDRLRCALKCKWAELLQGLD